MALGYKTIFEAEDWGAVISKVILDIGEPVSAKSISKDTFTVHVSRRDPRLEDSFLEEGERVVTNAYLSDEKGIPVSDGVWDFVTLELKIAPDDTLGSAQNYDFKNTGYNDWVDYEYTVTQVKDIETDSGVISGLVINKFAGETRVLVDDFSSGEATYGDIHLTYADFVPEKGEGKRPLIVWLHGAGEGGTDPSIAIAGNKAVALAAPENQAIFGGAYVLAPQTPTYWMEGFDGFGDGTSIYEKAVMSLIEDYVARHPEIDPNKICVGGDSNGGYFTMLLIRDYPNYFAAAFPVCEALKDELVSDEDIQRMLQTPTWFITAKTDPVLLPEKYTVPTFNRLVEAGHKNVHISLFDDVRDTSGLYTLGDGTPFEYHGHWSWIYVYNNVPTEKIDGKDTTLFEWLAAQGNQGDASRNDR